MSRHSTMLFSSLAVLLSGWATLPLAGQSVRGRVFESESGAPVEGMFVALLDASGERRGGALTDASGLFRIQAPVSGRYHLRGERIGLRSVTSAAMTLGMGDAPFVELQTVQEAIQLRGLEVDGEERCRVDPEIGSTTARVWDEVRKALSVVAWSVEERTYRYRFDRFERELSPDGRTVLSEAERSSTGWSANPFRAISAAQLATDGFARGDAGGRIYYAPDAGVLLSDAFLHRYCFRLEREDGRLGLGFEPVERRLGVQIAGVLWLDREGVLDRVDYRYLDYDPWVRSDLVGGTVEFRQLENGAWIVPRWVVRMPVLGRPAEGGDHRLVALREEGGEVVRMTEARAEPPRRGDRGRIVGTVWDSAHAAPLAAAEVYASGTSHRATTAADGTFTLDALRGGEYALGILHPRLDSLELTVPPVAVVVTPGETHEVTLGLPAAGELLARRLCPPSERTDSTAVIVGRVRDGDTLEPLVDAAVRLTQDATDFELRAGRTSARSTWTEVRTDERGTYAFCAAPLRSASLTSPTHGRRSGSDAVPVAPRRAGHVLRVDLTFRPR